ncbi:hypothetical protein CBS9595_001069 [Malassezia furfur]|nr:hypothetical protein CBS9595_001069 [Malassezia furfur]
MSSTQQASGRSLIAILSDEDSTTGFILAGVGDVNKDGQKNFFVTPVSEIEEAFTDFTKERKDIAIVLISQYAQAFPALLEIPSKDHPYDPSKDGVLKRVQKLFAE